MERTALSEVMKKLLCVPYCRSSLPAGKSKHSPPYTGINCDLFKTETLLRYVMKGAVKLVASDCAPGTIGASSST